MKLCPLCRFRARTLLYPSTLSFSNTKDNQYLCTSNSYGLHGPIHRCRNCDFVFVVDNNSPKNILNNYEKVEDPLYVAEAAGRRKTFARHLRHLSSYGTAGRLLDVGAYTGLFLSQAQAAGWQVAGVEPSRWAVSQAKKLYGLTLCHGPLKANGFPKNFFKAITIWDVIEHFSDPLTVLKICFDYLTPGGVLAMSTVDIDSPVAGLLGKYWPWMMRMHRVYFSKSTMARALKQAGFTNIHFHPHIRYVSLRYLLSRFSTRHLPFDNIVIPFYIGDLFDVYAQKPKS